MQMLHRRISFSVQPEFYILLVLTVLLIPLKWVAAWFLAAAFHELLHCVAVGASGGHIYAVDIGGGGAVIRTDAMPPAREILCALAGPAAGLIAIFVMKWFPRFAICALFQSAYNLLPILPLDGGRAVKCIVGLFADKQKETRIVDWIQKGTLAAVMAAGAYATVFLRIGFLPILLSVVLCLRYCKNSLQR